MTKLDTLLFWYTLTFSTALIVTALGSGLNLSNLTTIAFFLPVPAYLLLQSIKRYYLWRQTAIDANPPVRRASPNFSPKSFLVQTNPAFIITLVLLIAAWFISMITLL